MWLGSAPCVELPSPGNFDQQRAHGRAELGLEEQIQNLAALRFGIILQQNRSRAAPPPLTAPMPSVKRLPPASPFRT
jgi:hypothetical protein